MKRIKTSRVLMFVMIIPIIIIGIEAENCNAECYTMKLFIAGIVFIIGTIYSTMLFKKSEKIIFGIESLPLMSTCDTTEGVPFAGEGFAESDDEQTLKAPYSQKKCLYFHSIKEKFVRSGKQSHWKTIENISLFVPFHFKDKNGEIKIDLTSIDKDLSGHKLPKQYTPDFKNSEIDCIATFRKSSYSRRSKGIVGTLRKSKYRITEYILEPGQRVFVHGVPIKKNKELVLHEKGNNLPLIVSHKSRDRYVKDFYQGGSLVYLSYLWIVIGYLVSLYSVAYLMELSRDISGTAAITGCLVIMFAAFSSIYNRIITLRERANGTLSNIEIELKRRFNLIPNLVSAVKQYSKHEKEMQGILTKARMELSFSNELKEQKQNTTPLHSLVFENYPELRALDNFEYLDKKLIETEKRIAYSREFYNKTVRKHNTLIKQMPFLIIASTFQMKEMKFLLIDNKKTKK